MNANAGMQLGLIAAYQSSCMSGWNLFKCLCVCGRAGGPGHSSSLNEEQQEETLQMISYFPPLQKLMIRFHWVKWVTTQPFAGRLPDALLHTRYYWLITSYLLSSWISTYVSIKKAIKRKTATRKGCQLYSCEINKYPVCEMLTIHCQ